LPEECNWVILRALKEGFIHELPSPKGKADKEFSALATTAVRQIAERK